MMEVRIKKGDGLKCQYSGNEASVLIKIYEHDAQDSEKSSGWICADALKDAYNMLQAAEGRVEKLKPIAAQAAPQLLTETPTLAPVVETVAKPQAQPEKPKDNPQLMANFQKDLVQLINEPPKSREGEKDGLSEIHVKELIGKYRGAFLDLKGSMWPILNRHIGMTSDRFNFIVDSLNRV